MNGINNYRDSLKNQIGQKEKEKKARCGQEKNRSNIMPYAICKSLVQLHLLGAKKRVHTVKLLNNILSSSFSNDEEHFRLFCCFFSVVASLGLFGR